MSLLPDKNATQKRNSKKSKGQKSSKELIQWKSNHKNIVLEFINEFINLLINLLLINNLLINLLVAVLYQKLDGMKKL